MLQQQKHCFSIFANDAAHHNKHFIVPKAQKSGKPVFPKYIYFGFFIFSWVLLRLSRATFEAWHE